MLPNLSSSNSSPNSTQPCYRPGDRRVRSELPGPSSIHRRLGSIPPIPQELHHSLATRFYGAPQRLPETRKVPFITSAKLVILPEALELGADDHKTIWVALEVMGHVGGTMGSEQALDVAIIVDDS